MKLSILKYLAPVTFLVAGSASAQMIGQFNDSSSINFQYDFGGASINSFATFQEITVPSGGGVGNADFGTIDISGSDTLLIRAQLLSTNVASVFEFAIFNADDTVKTKWDIPTNLFNTETMTTVALSFTDAYAIQNEPPFGATSVIFSDVAKFQIGEGFDNNGGALGLRMEFAEAVVIPEPATTAAVAAVLVLMCVGFRRRRARC
ncbi:MAG: PEP-CTERM sorting domain-containing protein [Puniceicoccaceae bacterium]|nr:MAG: PEP-CTERM sorting domain-containing protein [Puniceicoccaceae bacterium]